MPSRGAAGRQTSIGLQTCAMSASRRREQAHGMRRRRALRSPVAASDTPAPPVSMENDPVRAAEPWGCTTARTSSSPAWMRSVWTGREGSQASQASGSVEMSRCRGGGCAASTCMQGGGRSGDGNAGRLCWRRRWRRRTSRIPHRAAQSAIAIWSVCHDRQRHPPRSSACKPAELFATGGQSRSAAGRDAHSKLARRGAETPSTERLWVGVRTRETRPRPWRLVWRRRR